MARPIIKLWRLVFAALFDLGLLGSVHGALLYHYRFEQIRKLMVPEPTCAGLLAVAFAVVHSRRRHGKGV
jgi:hypothetical protein